MLDRHYNIYFFHILFHIDDDSESIKWTFYKSNKSFLTFPGLFTVKGWRISGQDEYSEATCLELGSNCVAVEKMTNGTFKLLQYLDIDTFEPSEDVVTRIKVKNLEKETRILGKNSWDTSRIDFCCPDYQKVKHEPHKVKDSIQRVSCDISEEDFLASYVRKT